MKYRRNILGLASIKYWIYLEGINLRQNKSEMLEKNRTNEIRFVKFIVPLFLEFNHKRTIFITFYLQMYEGHFLSFFMYFTWIYTNMNSSSHFHLQMRFNIKPHAHITIRIFSPIISTKRFSNISPISNKQTYCYIHHSPNFQFPIYCSKVYFENVEF